MQIPVAEQILASNQLLAESKSSSHGGRLIAIHRPESRRLILQLLTSSFDRMFKPKFRSLDTRPRPRRRARPRCIGIP